MRTEYDPSLHHRRSIRLKGYDYSLPGAAFVTICVQGRQCLFGQVVDDEMALNEAGQMIQNVWEEIPTYYPGVDVDALAIMPNHIHGIILLTPPPVGLTGQPQGVAPTGPITPVGAGPRACPDAAHHVGAGPRACPRPSGRSSATHEPTVAGEPPGTGQPQGVAEPPTYGKPRDTGQPQGVAPTRLAFPDVVHRFKTMTTKRYVDGVKQKGWPPFPGRLWQRNYYEHIIRDEQDLLRIREYILENPARWSEDRENPANTHIEETHR
ncbi:MAG: transposase [Chloroflexota bacterium]|jgi:putative transposase